VFIAQLNSFLAIILPTCQVRRLSQFCSSAPKLIFWQAGVSKLNWPKWYICHFYNLSARTRQKTQPLYCREGAFIAPLHINGIYSIVACVFVSAGMCLPSSCLVMDVSSDFTIPAFGRHDTIWITCAYCLHILYTTVISAGSPVSSHLKAKFVMLLNESFTSEEGCRYHRVIPGCVH
jgi:hypothetical protein